MSTESEMGIAAVDETAVMDENTHNMSFKVIKKNQQSSENNSLEKSQIWGKVANMFIILMFLAYPNIVLYSIQAFKCIAVDGDQRLKVDL